MKFERDLDDDEAIIEECHKFPGLTRGAKLVAQFCRELQDAFDDGMAGSFQVIQGPTIGRRITKKDRRFHAGKVNLK